MTVLKYVILLCYFFSSLSCFVSSYIAHSLPYSFHPMYTPQLSILQQPLSNKPQNKSSSRALRKYKATYLEIGKKKYSTNHKTPKSRDHSPFIITVQFIIRPQYIVQESHCRSHHSKRKTSTHHQSMPPTTTELMMRRGGKSYAAKPAAIKSSNPSSHPFAFPQHTTSLDPPSLSTIPTPPLC